MYGMAIREEKEMGHIDGEMGLTNKIKKAMYDVARSYLYIGFLLAEAQQCEYYLEKGYDSIYDYAQKELSFKKSSVCNFIAVYREFSDDGNMFMKHKYEHFKYSQLVEMLSLSPKQRADITPEMTVRQIRDVKKNLSDSTDSVQTSGRKKSIALTIDIPNHTYMELVNRCGLQQEDIAQRLLGYLEAIVKAKRSA